MPTRIVFVDDEATLVQAVHRQLSERGYQVAGFTCPVDALCYFRDPGKLVHAVVTDHRMPRMNGLELAREIRRVRPDVPILMVSGFQELEEEQLEAGGILQCLPKPLRRDELLNALERLLDRSGRRTP